jgi:hypothetical protein
MRNIAQTNVSLENDLLNSISGYNGYQVPEARQKTDMRLREFLSEKLQRIEKDLSQFEHRFYQQNKNVNLNPFHRISLSLKMLIQSIIESSTNNDHFFSQSKIDSDKITQLNDYDVKLVNQVDILVDEVKELDNINGEYEIDEMLNHFYDLLDGINQILSERDFLIMSE